ncbi:hypothetical protein [Neobacillus sp. DY30]|uniref:hypothetical protein n=1 Tax=Neobacillus sp. DY30 TaxID=3047871 RepID=UPI0024BFB1E2|nr:hypothetical protein [Neobacillus sp. DY30]WHY01850.1 hypothetical protein QNH29_06375 [Neobacillus sp. DY30]
MSKTHVIDGVTYAEVDGQAEVGDYVIIKSNGVITKVIDRGDFGIFYSEGKPGILDHGYKVLEPLTSNPDIHDLLANLARRVEYLERKASSLEQQLRDTQGNCEKLAEELATVKHQSAPKEVEVVTFEKFLDSIADKVAERLVGQARKEGVR